MALYCVGIDPRDGEVKVRGPCRSDAAAFKEGEGLKDSKIYRHQSTNLIVAGPRLKRQYAGEEEGYEESSSHHVADKSRFQDLKKRLFSGGQSENEQSEDEEW